MVLSETDEMMAVAELRKRLLLDGTVKKQLQQGGEGPLDDFTLLRWLRAEKLDVDSAEKRLRDHAAWRVEYVPDCEIAEDEIASELAEPYQCFLQGCNTDGKPLVVLVLGRRDPSTRSYEEAKRCLCYTMDAAIAAVNKKTNPEGKINFIMDMRELTYAKLDTGMRTVVLDVLAGQYPERLNAMYIFEASYFVTSAWWVISSFVDGVTREKFQFLSGPTAKDDLRKAFNPQILPVAFGGDAEWVPVQQAVRKLRRPVRDDSAENL